VRTLAVLLGAAALAAPPAQRPSSALHLHQIASIGGAISPKSVVSSQHGLFFAQNMMYRHTITVYDRRFRLVKTIQDRVNLGRLGYPQYPGAYRGAPVEAAFTSDGAFAYVSNYSMYGPKLKHQGDDVCSPASGIDRSFVYRIDVARLRIDQAIQVGSVPKFLAVSPDNRFLLVSNWCSYDLSVVNVGLGRRVRTIPLGAYPRGIAVRPSSRAAYVAVMGSSDIARVNLTDWRVSWIRGVGSGPRHLVLGPTGRYLYTTLNGEGRVAKIDLRTGGITRAFTGSAPRSMAIADDGRSLYVVNYESNSLSKVRTSDMRVLQTVPTAYHPIGVTYDAPTREVWVSCYGGAILVFRDG
jgi:YVTN family beta-propeller protein